MQAHPAVHRRARALILISLITVLSASTPARSAAANTLTPEEFRDGWILLFDGATTFGWAPRGPAEWVIENDYLTTKPGTGRGFLCTTTEFADFRIRAEFWIDERANSGVFLRCPTAGDIATTNAYEVNIYDPHDKWPTGSINDVARTVGTPKTTGRWNTYEITAEGPALVVRLNGEEVVRARDSKVARGVLGLQQYYGEGVVRFRNLKLQPMGMQSLFNGKDLAGWKEIPGRKSRYTVTPEGWLNVRDGNGDLQTESQHGDFVLQLDIISNGDHLNSGVFFRALPGLFWSGYESQIRNQWEGEDRTRPVDYGTGGIYNRQAARRVVSSDREWFTKTIVAAGPHFAVWVNGIQVSDWTDRRAPSPNARQGYRAAPGVISLQGHDPTTDLSFRDLRIADYPEARP